MTQTQINGFLALIDLLACALFVASKHYGFAVFFGGISLFLFGTVFVDKLKS